MYILITIESSTTGRSSSYLLLHTSSPQDGKYFVSGGADKLVKIWEYDDGLVAGVGKGHSGPVTAVKFSPDQKKVVSVGEEGAILIWQVKNVLSQPTGSAAAAAAAT